MAVARDEHSALTRAAPEGLIVRRSARAHGEGPFREAMVVRTEIALAPTLLSTETIAALALPFITGGLVAVAIAWQGLIALAVLAGLVTLAARPWRIRRGVLLVVTDEGLRFADGRSLSLADVRAVDVQSRRAGEVDLAVVKVATPGGPVDAAVVESPRHARYLADVIDQAWREYLRRRR